MKKLIIPSLIVCSLFASEQNFIEIGGGFLKEKDNFSTSSNNKITNYTQAKSQTEVIPNISFYYGGEISDNSKLYIASEFGNLVLGNEMETNVGLLDFGLKGELMNEAWENPFLLNTSRKKTDVSEYGAYLGYGIPLSDEYMAFIKYEYSTIDYDKDNVVSDLKRDGKKHIVTFENMFDLNEEISLMGNLVYEKYSADGKASSYNSAGFELAMINKINNNLELSVMGGISNKEFDKINPLLNKKIDSTTISLHTSLKLNEPLEYKNSYVKFDLGYEKEDANHDFYDKNGQFAMFSLGYKF